MVTKTKLFVPFLILVAIGGHIVEMLDQDRMFVRSGGDMRSYARLLVQDAQPIFKCRMNNGVHSRPLHMLMRAITTVETHASSKMERFVETAAVRLAVLLDWTVPDYSLGPGQIRPSTAIIALRSMVPRADGLDLAMAPVALRLLRPCDNYLTGLTVLSWLARQNAIGNRQLHKRDILTIAGQYNAKGGGHGLQGAVAIKLYQGLVFHTYQELRFQALAQGVN